MLLSPLKAQLASYKDLPPVKKINSCLVYISNYLMLHAGSELGKDQSS